jgi:hypothetical protein
MGWLYAIKSLIQSGAIRMTKKLKEGPLPIRIDEAKR